MDKASTENERNAVLATTASGREITFVQVAGLVARRILCYTKVGEKLTRGERYGFIRFGSRVDMYLPVDAQAQVAIGDKVTGVRTVLARYQSKPLKLPHRLKLQALPKLLNPKSKRLPIKSAMPRNRL